MGNVEFERAKLSLGFAVPPPTVMSQLALDDTTRCYSGVLQMAVSLAQSLRLCIAMMHCLKGLLHVLTSHGSA